MEEKALKGRQPHRKQVEDLRRCSPESRRVRLSTQWALTLPTNPILWGLSFACAKENGEVSNAFKLFLTADPAEADVDGMIAEAVSEATDGLKWEKAASGTCPVILRWDAMTSILYTFSGVFSADSAQKGMSLLKGREGEMIAADCVSIIDDPHMAEGAASRPFDGEGVPPIKRNVKAVF